MAAVRARYPAIEFADSGMAISKQDQENEVVKEIQNSGADCLFIGMPTPERRDFSLRTVAIWGFLL